MSLTPETTKSAYGWMIEIALTIAFRAFGDFFDGTCSSRACRVMEVYGLPLPERIIGKFIAFGNTRQSNA